MLVRTGCCHFGEGIHLPGHSWELSFERTGFQSSLCVRILQEFSWYHALKSIQLWCRGYSRDHCLLPKNWPSASKVLIAVQCQQKMTDSWRLSMPSGNLSRSGWSPSEKSYKLHFMNNTRAGSKFIANGCGWIKENVLLLCINHFMNHEKSSAQHSWY